jgi:hypothetical protein
LIENGREFLEITREKPLDLKIKNDVFVSYY